MKPLDHAQRCVDKYGGKIEDYIKINNSMDFSKSSVGDMKHRMMLHHTTGIWLMESIFGEYITNSDNVKVSVRDIAEQHVIDDLGYIPDLKDWTNCLESQPWMYGSKRDPSTPSSKDFKDIKPILDEMDKEDLDNPKLIPPLIPPFRFPRINKFPDFNPGKTID